MVYFFFRQVSMKELVDCDKELCSYYHKYYDTILYRGAEVPNFGQTSEYCTYLTKPDNKLKTSEQIGVRLVMLNKCPKKDGKNK